MSDTFVINRGSDLNFAFNWPDGAGGNLNLTGATIAAYDLHPALAGLVTLAISTPATGRITGRIEWGEAIPMGRVASFRVRVTLAGNDMTTTPLWVQVQ